jgi:TRAP-type C4-dicarboxylate transport system substrate-binding protein
MNMKFISEQVIDAVIDDLDTLDEQKYEQQLEAFAESQPVIMAYLFNEENFHLLTEDERGFTQYLCLIAWMAIEREHGTLESVSEELIGEAEEKNYEVLDLSTAKAFRERLDPFFEGYPQEDLLAFIEEAVLEDEDDPDAIVTKEGRETVFVAAKSVLDALLGI